MIGLLNPLAGMSFKGRFRHLFPLQGVNPIKRDGTRLIKDHADELDLIINASHRMARIVDNIRTFSRQSDFKPQPIDPLTPLDDALMHINEQLRLHGIEVERPAGDGTPRGRGVDCL